MCGSLREYELRAGRVPYVEAVLKSHSLLVVFHRTEANSTHRVSTKQSANPCNFLLKSNQLACRSSSSPHFYCDACLPA